MATFHLPCRFDCPATCDYTRAVVRELSRVDAAYARQVETFLQQPCLVINEIACYILIGGRHVGRSRVRYERAVPAGGKRRLDHYASDLAAAAEIEITNGAIVIRRPGDKVRVIEPRCDSDGIELPALLDFR